MRVPGTQGGCPTSSLENGATINDIGVFFVLKSTLASYSLLPRLATILTRERIFFLGKYATCPPANESHYLTRTGVKSIIGRDVNFSKIRFSGLLK